MVRIAKLPKAPEPDPEKVIAIGVPFDYVTETLPLALSATDSLTPGTGHVHGPLAAAIGVRNLGTTDLIVNIGPAGTKPEGFIGPGAAIVPSGVFAVLDIPGPWHSFYGRPGELVQVTRYREAQPPVTVNGARRYHPVTLAAPITSGIAYLTPWGTPALYGGFSCAETSGTASAKFRIRDGNVAGNILEVVTLAPNESTSDEDIDQLCASRAIFVELVSGSVELQLRVN